MAHMDAHHPPLYQDHQDLLPRPGHTDSPASLDPVVVLPPEISSQCIREALEFGRKDSAQILDFSTVSRGWQDLIFSTPSLWGRIQIDRFMPDRLATIAAFAQLSAAVPIDLVLWTELDADWTSISSLLVPHIHRIRSLTIGYHITRDRHESSANAPTLLALVSSVMNSLGSLPGLQVLDFGENYPIGSSNLRLLALPPNACIYSAICFEPSEDNRHLAHVTKIITDYSLGSLIAARVALVRLSSIIFGGSSDNNSVDGSRVLDTSRVFTALTSLSYLEYNNDAQWLLDQIGPQLLYLDLKIAVADISGFITRLAKLARLQHLELLITNWESTGLFHSVNCDIVIPGLRKLSLSQYGDHRWNIEPLHSITFRTLFGAFANMYPGAEKIEFSGTPDILRFAGDYIEGLTSLETLSLYNIDPNPTPHSQIWLPRLRNLAIDDFNSIAWVHIPEIRNLGVGPLYWDCEPPLWNQPHDLRQLTIKSSYDHIYLIMDGHLDLYEVDIWSNALTECWDLSRHHRLVCIRLGSKLLINRHGNDLCEEIIYNPGLCPLLEEIEFCHFVDWDLLFIMLERRNIGNPNCRMIGKVTIPYVPFALRPSFHQLLQGIPAKRPSNIELSLEASREVICDPTIPGCLLCLKYMVPGCELEVGRVKAMDIPFEDFFHVNTRPSSKLPPELLSWMVRRRRLVEEWITSYSSFESEFYRKECCYARRYDGGSKIILYHRWELDDDD